MFGAPGGGAPNADVCNGRDRISAATWTACGAECGKWPPNCEIIPQSGWLANVRIDDLQYTFASLAASSGQSLLIIGELLGHSTSQTTKRYASLYDDMLREAAEGVSKSLRFSSPT